MLPTGSSSGGLSLIQTGNAKSRRTIMSVQLRPSVSRAKTVLAVCAIGVVIIVVAGVVRSLVWPALQARLTDAQPSVQPTLINPIIPNIQPIEKPATQVETAADELTALSG